MESQSNPEPLNSAPTPNQRGWLRENWKQLVIIGLVITAVCKFAHPYDVFLAGFGLSLIIFLHELGHFLAAKACNVHVRTFSIGFGPPLPFCQFQYGETTYKLGIIPLGGYVAMVGETTGESDTNVHSADDDKDPRNFKNKNVFQRMLIISAGVIMNMILAAICFVAAYMNGIEEKPAIISAVEPGSISWQNGIRPGTEITRINNLNRIWYDDIRTLIAATSEGEKISVDYTYQGEKFTKELEPLRQEGKLFPMLGISPSSSLKLIDGKREPNAHLQRQSAAAAAKSADDGPGFLGGDTIVAMSDPGQSNQVTPLEPGVPGNAEYHRRLRLLAGQEIVFHVVRKGSDPSQTVTVKVPAVFSKDTGLRMKMGPVVAIRVDSTAAKAGIKARELDAKKTMESAPGDVLTRVEVTNADGTKTRWSVDPNEKDSILLDPVRLPDDLNQWARKLGDRPSADWTVRVTVNRRVDHTDKAETFSLTWEPQFIDYNDLMTSETTPLSIGGLGIAYRVTSEVNEVISGSPAAELGLQRNDLIIGINFLQLNDQGGTKNGKDQEVEIDPKETGKLKMHRWAYVENIINWEAPHEVHLKIIRNGEMKEFKNLKAKPNPQWPSTHLGLAFALETRVQKASSIGEALDMGLQRTNRAVKHTYQSLYGMIAGRISYKLMSGPITLAKSSYFLAGQDVWLLVLFIGLVSVNLAVVNFLPIPMLDGGHMVFLLYELIFRRPAPEALQAILTWIGLILVMGLMLFTIGLDIKRHFF